MAQTNQERLALLLQYLLKGIELCRHDFQWHAYIFHVGEALYNFVAGDRFFNPGTNLD